MRTDRADMYRTARGIRPYLGHCRGHYDMRPIIDYYPTIERCAWEPPVFYGLLRRGIRWAARAA